MQIKNIVFDVGNVLVRWAPYEVIHKVFPQDDPKKFYKEFMPVWLDLNRGKVTEQQAVRLYQEQFQLPEEKFLQLMHEFKLSQTPLPGSIELLIKLKKAGFPLYSITDNTRELIEYHRLHSDFLPFFAGVVVSANIGILKPDERIYRHLLDEYKLDPRESVFIDDTLVNVEGAVSVGMQAFQFTTASACESQLAERGIIF